MVPDGSREGRTWGGETWEEVVERKRSYPYKSIKGGGKWGVYPTRVGQSVGRAEKRGTVGSKRFLSTDVDDGEVNVGSLGPGTTLY